MSEMQKPKLLRTMTWLAPGGGVDEQVYLSLNYLQNSFDITLLVGKKIESKKLLHIEGIKYAICPFMVNKMNPVLDFFAFIWIRGFLIKNRFDIIHTHESKSSLLTRLAKPKNHSSILIYGVHGILFNDPRSRLVNLIFKKLEKYTLGKVNYMIFVGEQIRKIYHEANIGLNIKNSVIYSGIDMDKFDGLRDPEKYLKKKKELAISPNSFIFINIGRFSDSKNQIETIRCFRTFCARYPELSDDCYLILVGEGPNLVECRKYVSQHNLSKRVIFLGYRYDIHELLGISDVNLLTSLREGLPRVIVEASLAGVPTIAYNVEGVSEVIQDNASGFICQTGDTSCFIEKMHTLSSQRVLSQKMGMVAKAGIGNRWGYVENNTQLEYIYRGLLMGRL